MRVYNVSLSKQQHEINVVLEGFNDNGMVTGYS